MGRNTDISHGGFQKEKVLCGPIALGQIIEVTDNADDFTCIIQAAVFLSIKLQIFDGVLPGEQVYIPFHISHAQFKSCYTIAVFKKKISNDCILVFKLFIHVLHRGIQFIIDRRNQVKGHEILFRQLLKCDLRCILGRPKIGIDLILQLPVAAGQSSYQTFEPPFGSQTAGIIFRFRKSSGTFKYKAVNFLPVFPVAADNPVNLHIQLFLFFRC